VPGQAFAEALAFLFEARGPELLGQPGPTGQAKALATLDAFWATYASAGPAMVDTAAWHWLYQHPSASPAELEAAVCAAARAVWNRWYAPVFGREDSLLLAVCSPMIDSFLYLPDYPLGRMIAFQIQRRLDQTGDPAGAFERMARLGRLTPDLWMMRATGGPVGPGPLLEAAGAALRELK
jgi:hypothetical protein